MSSGALGSASSPPAQRAASCFMAPRHSLQAKKPRIQMRRWQCANTIQIYEITSYDMRAIDHSSFLPSSTSVLIFSFILYFNSIHIFSSILYFKSIIFSPFSSFPSSSTSIPSQALCFSSILYFKSIIFSSSIFSSILYFNGQTRQTSIFGRCSGAEGRGQGTRV